MSEHNNYENRNTTDDIQEEYTLATHSVRRTKAERKIRKKRKKVNRMKSFYRFVLFILLVLASYYFFKLPQWYLPKDSFKKFDGNVIEVINNKIIPTSIIYEDLKGIKVPKVPIFLMGIEPIKKELFKNPVIRNIYVRRYGFPARIQIIIRERIPVAIIKTDLKSKPVAFFTSDGILIKNKNYMNLTDTKSTLKILTSSSQLDKVWTIKKYRYIEKIVKSVETYSNESVEYIDLRNPNDVYVKIQKVTIRLGTLDSTIFERVKRIYTILPQIDENDTKIKYIDLSWDKVNYLKLKKK